MPPLATVGILSIGDMGVGIAKLLVAHGYRVVTNVEGRRWGLSISFIDVLSINFGALDCLGLNAVLENEVGMNLSPDGVGKLSLIFEKE